ncbi:MAG: hypothetical protein B7Z52_04735, partial [Burkholderiales bacterium 12-64-5]
MPAHGPAGRRARVAARRGTRPRDQGVDQRRDEILQLIERQGFVSLQELVERLGASESTVRRDLEHLDEIGQIRRTRGGAAYTGDHITSFEERHTTSLPQKQR